MVYQSPGHNVGEFLSMFLMSTKKNAHHGEAGWQLLTKHWLSVQILCSKEHCLNFMVLLVLLSVRWCALTFFLSMFGSWFLKSSVHFHIDYMNTVCIL